MKCLNRSISALLAVACLLTSTLCAQQAVTSPEAAPVPHLVNFSGNLQGAQGKSMSRIVSLTFSIYRDQYAGSPLWMETQNAQPDSKGNYTVQLGATTSQGLPLDLFTSGEARWLGVRANGGEEQPRVLLLSVPYALKAADAQTLGGLPASAFALAGSSASGTQASESTASTNANSSPNVGGSGTQNYLPLWTDSNGDLGNSILYQTGSGSSAKIGINETKPLFTLDVNGQELVRGLFEIATQNYANKTKGYNSNPINLESSAFNSSTQKYTLNHFQWQAEPVGNNTTAPGATLNLLYGTDPATPTETGLNIASSGQITFANGQTFPGVGTVTSVGSGSGLTGGPITGSGALSIASGGVTNGMLANSSLSVTAGTDMTGGGTVSLGGSTTLNLDTTKVPQLNAANTFTGNQTISGNLSATSSSTAITGTMTGNNASVAAITGTATATGIGGTWGVLGLSSTSQGAGTVGWATGVQAAGVYANNPVSGYGVFATALGSSGQGVHGESNGSMASNGFGPDGVDGIAHNNAGYGVAGLNTDSSGTGVYGSGNFSGVYGNSINSFGVFGISTNGYGVSGNGSTGVYGSGTTGVTGSGTSTGVYGTGPYAVLGAGSSFGVLGTGPTGVSGQGTGNGSFGVSGTGVTAVSGTGTAVGVSGSGPTGVYGNGTNDGVFGYAPAVNGTGVSGNGGVAGVSGESGHNGYAIEANNFSDGFGLFAFSMYGWAGWFNGDVNVNGNLSANGKDFRIDHPLDPANKYLVHSSVESSEMKNIYDGVVTTDTRGEATVRLPEWFDALNTDFRYQLTVIGQFAQAIIAHEIEDRQFQIRTNAPNVKVCWQVTGVRHDAYAQAHPLRVEEDKPDKDRGFYLHPEFYGAPEEKNVSWPRSEEGIKRWKELRARHKAGQESTPTN